MSSYRDRFAQACKDGWNWTVLHFDTPKQKLGEVFIKAAGQGVTGAGIGAALSEISKATDILVVNPDKQTLVVAVLGLVGGVWTSLQQDRNGASAPGNNNP